MKKIHIFLFSCILISCACSNSNPNETENVSNSKIEMDTTALIDLAANDILKNLDAYIIVQSSFDNYGNYKIVFHEESTDEEMEELIHEYYSLEKSSLLIGDLDKDGKKDFAIESVWGPVMGNLYATTSQIFLQHNESWIKLPVNIQGGKGSSSETIISMENGILETEFREFDMDTYQLSDSIIKRKYLLEEGVLVLK